MPAVKRADTTHKIVIERRIRRVAVLSALYRLMVWRAVVVRVNLPAVSAQIIVGALADLCLHQPHPGHYVPAHGGFERGMCAALIIDPYNAFVCKVLRGLLDGRSIIRRACRNLHKCKIHALAVCILQRQRLPVRIYHAERLRNVG